MRVLLQGFWNRHPAQQPLWTVTCGPPTAATTALALQLQSRRLCDASPRAVADTGDLPGGGTIGAYRRWSTEYCSQSGRRMGTAHLTLDWGRPALETRLAWTSSRPSRTTMARCEKALDMFYSYAEHGTCMARRLLPMHLTHAAEMAEEQVRDAARDCGTLPVGVQTDSRPMSTQHLPTTVLLACRGDDSQRQWQRHARPLIKDPSGARRAPFPRNEHWWVPRRRNDGHLMVFS